MSRKSSIHTTFIRLHQLGQAMGLTLAVAVLSSQGMVPHPAIALESASRAQRFQTVQSPTASSAPTMLAKRHKLPESVSKAVLKDLARRLGGNRRRLWVVGFNRQMWPDGCLGLSNAGEACTAAMVEGWRVEVTNGQQNWVYRSDLKGRVVRLEEPSAPPSNTSGLPAPVAQRLLQVAARELRLPMGQLQIAEAKTATWDGCLGVYGPDTVCTQIALNGWQAILTNGSRSWVYHLNQDGSQIVHNAAAREGGDRLNLSFVPENSGVFPMENGDLFRITLSGSLTGQVTTTTLKVNGSVEQQTIAPNIRSRLVVVKQLTPEQLRQFQTILQANPMRNLHGLRYLTAAALADYPTTTLQTPDSTVQYIDLELEQLPPSLRSVIQGWQRVSG